jgi:hypothetical protein
VSYDCHALTLGFGVGTAYDAIYVALSVFDPKLFSLLSEAIEN